MHNYRYNNFNYLKEGKHDYACMHVPQFWCFIDSQSPSKDQLLKGHLAELPIILNTFNGIVKSTSTYTRSEDGGGGELATK